MYIRAAVWHRKPFLARSRVTNEPTSEVMIYGPILNAPTLHRHIVSLQYRCMAQLKMPFLVSALSSGPLSGQVNGADKYQQQKAVTSTGSHIYPGAPLLGPKGVSKGAITSSSHQRCPSGSHDHDAVLSKAFASASIALRGKGTSEVELIWQPTVYPPSKQVSLGQTCCNPWPRLLKDDIADIGKQQQSADNGLSQARCRCSRHLAARRK